MQRRVAVHAPETVAPAGDGEGLLLHLRSDRRLGHEWDDWDGRPLANGGEFTASAGLFFGVALLLIVVTWSILAGIAWLIAPRLALMSPSLPGAVWVTVHLAGVVAVGWLALLATMFRAGLRLLPPILAERGLLPAIMTAVERAAVLLRISRDRVGNSMLRVHNRLMSVRRVPGIAPEDLLILLPRCLEKEAMHDAMRISESYGVPIFVASRGRYAREMIGRRRPRAVLAVACERDLVSGVHDVAGRLPVLTSTLSLPDGPCRNTTFRPSELEDQVRRFLGVPGEPARRGEE